MDLRSFFQKLRKIEQEIVDPHVVVVSHETPDGGRAGQLAEVSRGNAARLILEGHAHLATAEESAEFRVAAKKALEEAQQRLMAERVQVNVISDADLRAIKSASPAEKPAKGR
jgi:ribosomal protein L9